jgi:NADH-quinone oxidoreductase subunit L
MDDLVIDEFVVNGLARSVRRMSARLRAIQSGFVYHYAFTMIIGLFLLITWFVAR